MGRTKEFNNYRIDNEITTIFVENRNKNIFEIFIDTEELHKFIQFNKSWHAVYDKCTSQYYARTIVNHPKTDSCAKWCETILMHRFILGTNTKDVVDHINHNQLDNRKSNLRIISISSNSRYREDKNKNNKSGYRNVCWLKDYNKWCVQIQINGKNTLVGKFDDVDEAGAYAEKMRQKYYGKFAGDS